MNLLVDTNCALYLLGGDKTVADFLDGKVLHVFFVTELELLSYPDLSKAEEIVIRQFLSNCFIVDMNARIKQDAVVYRKRKKLKLPDAIVAATARFLEIPLFTADSDFRDLKDLTRQSLRPASGVGRDSPSGRQQSRNVGGASGRDQRKKQALYDLHQQIAAGSRSALPPFPAAVAA